MNSQIKTEKSNDNFLLKVPPYKKKIIGEYAGKNSNK